VAYSHQQIVAIKDYLDRNPDTVLRTLRALIEGLAAWKDPAKKSLVMGHVAKRKTGSTIASSPSWRKKAFSPRCSAGNSIRVPPMLTVANYADYRPRC